MQLESIKLKKFAKNEIDKSMQSKISGGNDVLTWANSPNGNPDRDSYDCTGNNYDHKHYDYNGRLVYSESSSRQITT